VTSSNSFPPFLNNALRLSPPVIKPLLRSEPVSRQLHHYGMSLWKDTSEPNHKSPLLPPPSFLWYISHLEFPASSHWVTSLATLSTDPTALLLISDCRPCSLLPLECPPPTIQLEKPTKAGPPLRKQLGSWTYLATSQLVRPAYQLSDTVSCPCPLVTCSYLLATQLKPRLPAHSQLMALPMSLGEHQQGPTVAPTLPF
jgi:hypothetical protein